MTNNAAAFLRAQVGMFVGDLRPMYFGICLIAVGLCWVTWTTLVLTRPFSIQAIAILFVLWGVWLAGARIFLSLLR